jgi:hypothetical protein
MTRPIWRLMTRLTMFKHCQHDGLENSLWLEERVVNLPSSVPDGALPALRNGSKVDMNVLSLIGRTQPLFDEDLSRHELSGAG